MVVVVEEEFLTVAQIAQQLSLAENTTRRYMKLFRDFIPVQQNGRISKYPSESLEMVSRIAAMYQEGLSTQDIQQRLKRSRTRVIDVQPEPAESSPVLSVISEQLERQQLLIESLAERLDKQQAYIEENLNRRDQQLMTVLREIMERKQIAATAEEPQPATNPQAQPKRRWWKPW